MILTYLLAIVAFEHLLMYLTSLCTCGKHIPRLLVMLLDFKKDFTCNYVSVLGYVHMSSDAHKGQKLWIPWSYCCKLVSYLV